MTKQSDDARIKILDQINQVCRDFGKQVSQGNSPRIESFLSNVPEEARETLFANLLGIEINYRRSKGESPTSSEYVGRFPRCAKQVRRAFFEPSIESSQAGDAVGETPTNEPLDDGTLELTIDIPAANRLGEYDLLGKLGKGGMGIVYDARHTKTGNRVALKTLPTTLDGQSVDANKLHRFRREFRSLSEVNHPNLVGMQTLEVDGERWFFTMDLIQGEDFISYVRPDDQLNEDRLRDCLPQLARGIIALHQRGIVHRDLKPGNVMVTNQGKVVILDFGLVAELQQNLDASQTCSAMFVGTIPYAPPEQMFGKRTEANDWYAFGTMLYESLVGEVPFPGNNQANLLRKQQEDSPSLTEHDDLPSDLAELVDGLLCREASGRFGADSIAKFFQLDNDTQTQSSTQGSKGSSGSAGSVDEEHLDTVAFAEEEIVLIGREKQTAQLEEIKQEFLKTRQPSVVWVTGKSGEGKSSLAEKFLRPLRKSNEMLVLSGRCYDRESVPFKVIDSQIDSLVSFLRSRPESEVEAWLPNDIEMLARLFPLLRRVKPIERRAGDVRTNLDERQVRNLAFAALKDLLVSISQSTPIAMFVDDLQWGDADSAEVLAAVLRPPNPPTLLLLGSFRSDEMDGSPFLKEWRSHAKSDNSSAQERRVEVDPLTEAECLQLIEAKLGSQAGEDFRDRTATLFSDTKGNPYFLEQFLEAYDPTSGAYVPVPLSEIVSARLSRCPSGARALLEAIAVSGKAVSLFEVAAVADQTSGAIATITHMRSERIVRLIGSGDAQSVDTYHDKIRESVLAGLSEDERRRLHLQYAETLASNSSHASNRIFDLAHHFLEAGDARAFEHQLRAGGASLEAYAMENALEHLRTAKRLAPANLDSATGYHLESMLAKSLAGCQLFGEAINSYELALECSRSPFQWAVCRYEMGEIHFKRGEYKIALDAIKEAFAILGERLPQTVPGKLFATLKSAIAFHLLPSWASISLKKKPKAELVQISRMYAAQNQMTIQFDVYSFFLVSVRSCLAAKYVDDLAVKAESYAAYAAMWGFAGIHPISRRYIKIADGYEFELASPASSGVSGYYRGVCSFFTAQLDDAERSLEKASRLLKRAGDWRQAIAPHFLWHLWAIRGDANRVLQFAKEEEEIANQAEDGITLAFSKYGKAEGLARIGSTTKAVEVATEAVELLKSLDAAFLFVAYVQLARVRIQIADYDGAGRAAWNTIKDIPKMRFCDLSVPAFPLFAEAVLSDSWVTKARPISRGDHGKVTWAALAGRLSSKIFFRNSLPHSLRVSGRLAFSKGRDKKAMKFFRKAVAAAQQNGAGYEYARALIDKSMLDYPEKIEDRQRGIDLLESLGCVLPDAEVVYLGIDRETHHARASKAREK